MSPMNTREETYRGKIVVEQLLIRFKVGKFEYYHRKLTPIIVIGNLITIKYLMIDVENRYYCSADKCL